MPLLDQQGATPISQLAGVAHGASVAVGGLVIACQRPQTANGIIFLLLEDAGGNLNVIVPEKLYELHRLTIRTEPLILVHGRLERHAAGDGAINLLAWSRCIRPGRPRPSASCTPSPRPPSPAPTPRTSRPPRPP